VPIEGLGPQRVAPGRDSASGLRDAAFPDLRDLRVFNGAGEVVAYAFRPVERNVEKLPPVVLPIFPCGVHVDAGRGSRSSFDQERSKVTSG